MTKYVFYALYEAEKSLGWIEFCEGRKIFRDKLKKSENCFEKNLALEYLDKHPDVVSKEAIETEKIWKHWHEKFMNIRDYS